MLTIKNINVSPGEAPNDGGASVQLRAGVFTPHDGARVASVEVDLTSLNGPAAYPLAPDPAHVLAETNDGVYQATLSVPLLTDAGVHELPLLAQDSAGNSGRGRATFKVVYRRPAYAGGLLAPASGEVLARLGGRPIVGGNRIETLVDGDAAMQRRLELIAGAQRQINVMTYIMADEGLSGKLVRTLLDKAGAGVEVNVLLNADTQLPSSPIGTVRMKFNRLLLDLQALGRKWETRKQRGEKENEWLKSLTDLDQDARGVNLILFNAQLLREAGVIPARPNTTAHWLQRLQRAKRGAEDNERTTAFRGPGGLPAWPLLDYATHEKILVADGERAIVGGRNPWLDLDLDLAGPLVAQIQQGFLRGFSELAVLVEGARPPTMLFGANAPAGEVSAQFVQSRPWMGEYHALHSLLTAIQMARRSLYISSQYVILPDSLLRDALLEAAERGVDVRILTNSQATAQEVGFAASYYISLNYFADLLAAGIRLYEINGLSDPAAPQPYYHVKEFLIDGEFASIGSVNLTIRSSYIESENMVNIFDPALAAAQEALFLHRIEREATEITPAYLRQLHEQHKNKMEIARVVELLY
jgi:phosphatidylserine/phosphatidylglycerophosphate/cardiolipin synthase-like enzyme